MTLATPQELSLNEAAEALGVHYMTVYRYIRTGELPARQIGRRWVISQADLNSFRAVDSAPISVPANARAMRECMERGDEDGAWDLLVAYNVHREPLMAQQALITPALRETGQRWADGLATIAQEHMATVVAQRLISRLGIPKRRGRRSGTVLVACPAGDPHTLATALFANLVRGEGADVVDLAQVIDPAVLLEAAGSIDGSVSVAIAVTLPEALPAAAELVAGIRDDPKIAAVLVGGLAVPDEETALEVGSDLYFATPELAAAGATAAARI